MTRGSAALVMMVAACGSGRFTSSESKDAGAPDGNDSQSGGSSDGSGGDAVSGASGGPGTGGAAGGNAVAGAPGTGGAPDSGGIASCEDLATQCQTESCCTSIAVPSGSFPMGRSDSGTSNDNYPEGNPDELPEHTATLATFSLDKYEVTVGRFRRFLADYEQWRANGNPTNGAGTNPNHSSTGWDGSWNASLPTDQASFGESLKCDSSGQTWTDTPAGNEAYAINCVSWFHAFAFCIWDGGRLPSEAEWEYAAAGGEENRLFPWGSLPPANGYANFLDTSNTPYVPVGGMSAGAGRWGHLDLAGGMWEWVFDFHSSYSEGPCTNCAVTSGTSRVSRGGGFLGAAATLRAAYRTADVPTRRANGLGFRCSR